MPDMFTLEESGKFCVWNKWPRLNKNIKLWKKERNTEKKKKTTKNYFQDKMSLIAN